MPAPEVPTPTRYINYPNNEILNNLSKLIAEKSIILIDNMHAVDLALWEKFSLIKENNCVYRSHAICKSCYQPLALRNAKGLSIGTNNLKRHKCRIINRQMSVEQFLKPKIKLSTDCKAKLKEKISDFIVMGYHSLRTADQLKLKEIFSIGVKYGSLYNNIDVNEAWSGRMTISRYLDTIYFESKEKLKFLLREPSKMKSICLLSDIWTDQINHNSFLDVTVHYVDENFKTMCNCISFSHFPTSHSSNHIITKINQVCEDFDIDMKKTYFVTDSASNYISALSDGDHYRCMSHRLHTVVKDAWEHAKKFDDETRILSQKINDCKRYFHMSANKESKLPYKILSESCTRPWSGLNNLFNSIKLSYVNIKVVLMDDNMEQYFLYNERLVICYNEVFSSLDTYFKNIQQNSATLHLCIVNLVEMIDLAKSWPNEVNEFKLKFLEGLESKYASHLKTAHIIGLFFHPNYKKFECLKCIPQNDEVQNAILNIVSTIVNFFKITNSEILVDDFIDSTENQDVGRKRKFMDSMYTMDTSLSSANTPLIEKETQNYLNEPVSLIYDDPLTYWVNSRYSNLKNIARSIYSIPASSAECERHASRAGLTLQTIRNRMKPHTLEKLVFLRDFKSSK